MEKRDHVLEQDKEVDEAQSPQSEDGLAITLQVRSGGQFFVDPEKPEE